MLKLRLRAWQSVWELWRPHLAALPAPCSAWQVQAWRVASCLACKVLACWLAGLEGPLGHVGAQSPWMPLHETKAWLWLGAFWLQGASWRLRTCWLRPGQACACPCPSLQAWRLAGAWAAASGAALPAS